MIIETFAGANLLGSVSRGGVIEGWMVAVVLTIVNVLLGVVAGRMWRFTHYGWGFVKLFGYIQGAFFTVVALPWNIIAGHVRDVYVLAEKTGALEAPDEAFATAWRTMIERPLPWESLPSRGVGPRRHLRILPHRVQIVYRRRPLPRLRREAPQG